MKTGRQPRQFFKLVVKPYRIALQPRNVRIGTYGVNDASRMPCRSRGQFLALQQNAVCATQLGQMIENRAADNATANNEYSHMRGHSVPLTFLLAPRSRPSLVDGKIEMHAAIHIVPRLRHGFA